VLTVRWTDRYLRPDGVWATKADSPTSITAQVEGESGYTHLQGQDVGPGQKVFEGVPPAPVLVCGRGGCVYTCRRDVNLGQDFFGRPFPGWNLNGKGVGLTLDSLEPWSRANDRFQLTVPNIRYTAPVSGAFSPPEGASTLDFRLFVGSPDLSSNVSTVTPVPELSAAEGDTVIAQQFRTRTLEVVDEEGAGVTFRSSTAERFAQVSSYPDGYSTHGLSVQTPPAATASFSVPAGPLAALVPEMGPEVVPERLRAEVRAARWQEATLVWQRDVPQLSVEGSRWVVPEGQTFSYGVTSAEPARILEVTASARSSSYLYDPSVGWRRELKEGVSEVLRPEVGPVRDLRVNGLPDANPTPRSRPRVVSWAAPSVGEAHQYEVLVYSADGRDAHPVQILRLVTTERAVLLPNVSLSHGEAFRFIVRSVYRPGSDPEEFPLHESVPVSWADRVSAELNRQ
jgi:hypothetical protein